MKVIYLEPPPSGVLHSLYNSLINYPPEGYMFIRGDKNRKKYPATLFLDRALLRYLRQNDLLNYFTGWPSILYASLKKKTRPKEASLTYSSQHPILRKEAWVVDLEYVTGLLSYGHLRLSKGYLEKILGSPYCRKILPWTEASKKTIVLNLNCARFIDKIEVVHLAVLPKKVNKAYSDNVNLLFVGTANIHNIPWSFELKGGLELLKAFKILSKNYPNLKLTIRAWIPEYARRICEKLKNVRIIDKILPSGILDKIFRNADIFVFPCHQTPGRVILDAMSYGLPIVTSDVWANSEMVEDGRNGYLIKKSPHLRYINKGYVPNWGSWSFLRKLKAISPDRTMVSDLVKKLQILIEDEKLRKRMSADALMQVERGKFSINERNRKLKRIFDESIA